MRRTLIALMTGSLLMLSGAAVYAQTPTPDGTGTPQTGQLRQKRNRQPNPARQQLRNSLTEAQKAQFKQLHEQNKAAIENILTEAQKAQLNTAIAQGKSHRQAMSSLNLSAEQKAQIKQLAQSRREQAKNFLTPEQQQLLKNRAPRNQ